MLQHILKRLSDRNSRDAYPRAMKLMKPRIVCRGVGQCQGLFHHCLYELTWSESSGPIQLRTMEVSLPLVPRVEERLHISSGAPLATLSVTNSFGEPCERSSQLSCSMQVLRRRRQLGDKLINNESFELTCSDLFLSFRKRSLIKVLLLCLSFWSLVHQLRVGI